jgi:hypothetical protein
MRAAVQREADFPTFSLSLHLRMFIDMLFWIH